MERMQRGVEQVAQQEHVHAPPAQERFHDAAGDERATNFALLEIDEDRLALRRELALGGEPCD